MQLWAIQSKLKHEDSTLHLVKAFQKFGLNWGAFPMIPFSEGMPDFGWADTGSIFYYGSVGIITRIQKRPDLHPRAVLFFDSETHTPKVYGPKYGEDYLNHDARIVLASDFLLQEGEKTSNKKEKFFIRPNSGVKTFAGGIFSFNEIDKFLQKATFGEIVLRETEILVNSVKPIRREFRTWVIDGEVVEMAGYRQNEGVKPFRVVPSEVRDFAEAQAEKFAPSTAFVLDVAELEDKSLKVVEINSVHSSGFYVDDVIEEVVWGLSNHIAKFYP